MWNIVRETLAWNVKGFASAATDLGIYSAGNEMTLKVSEKGTDNDKIKSLNKSERPVVFRMDLSMRKQTARPV